MKYRMLLTAVLLAMLCVSLDAQTDSSAPATGGEGAVPQTYSILPPPQTRVESFGARKGALIIKGYTDIGSVAGDDGSSIRISTVQFTDAARAETQYGLVVRVAQAGNGDRQTISYIDEDEIRALLASLEAMGKLEASATAMAEFEARYETRGDLEFTNLNMNGARALGLRGVQIIAPTGQVIWANAYFRLARISEIHDRMAEAEQLLQKIKAAR